MPTRKGGESYLQKGGLVGKPIGPRNTFIAALQSYEETGPAFSGWKKKTKKTRTTKRERYGQQTTGLRLFDESDLHTVTSWVRNCQIGQAI